MGYDLRYRDSRHSPTTTTAAFGTVKLPAPVSGALIPPSTQDRLPERLGRLSGIMWRDSYGGRRDVLPLGST